MGKRKTHRTNGVTVVRKIVEREDTGIYEREIVVGEQRETWAPEQVSAMLHGIADHSAKLAAELDRLATAARNMLLPHAVREDPPQDLEGNRRAIGRQHKVLDLGDGPLCYSLPANPTEDIAEPLEVLQLIAELRSVQSGHYELVNAYRLGRIVERIGVRPFEPMVKHEKTRRAGKRQAADERKSEVVRLYQELGQSGRFATKEPVVKAIVNSTGYSEKAIWGYLKGIPTPRRRKT